MNVSFFFNNVNVITFIQEIERIDFWDAVKELAKIENIDITKYDDSVSCTVKYNGYYNTHTGKTDSTLVVIFEFNEGESSNNLNIASNIELLISNIKQKYAQRYIEG